jgi:hypothetical protein
MPGIDDFVLNDISLASNDQVFTMSVPPRVQDIDDMPSHFDLTDIVNKWAVNKKMKIIAENHIVVCEGTGKIFLIDYLMERDSVIHTIHVYYARQRGGRRLAEMKSYATKIQDICKTKMKIQVEGTIICIYGKNTAKIYSSNITQRRI